MKKLTVVLLFILFITGSVGSLSFVDINNDGQTVTQNIQNGIMPFDSDSDNDGLSNNYEQEINTDLLSKDTDNDGLSDYEEVREYQTDPTDADTDGDTLSDQKEVKVYETDPTKKDTDGDRLTDREEIINTSSDPTEADTDNDRLNDYQEVRIHNSDPTKADTDEDGLLDYHEVESYGTNPTDADTDGDRLNDSAEINKYNTDSLEMDTDNDNLTDGREVLELDTDPTKADTDNDDLDDNQEVLVYDSNPTESDTSGNGLMDGEAVEYGLDPTEWDSSGDGISDKYAVDTNRVDPVRLNIIVKIDYSSGANLPQEIRDVQQVFDNAPVQSDTNKSGINLVYNISDSSITDDNDIDFQTYVDNYYRSQENQYHVIFVEELQDQASDGDNFVGITSDGIDGMIVQTNQRTSRDTASTFMHEIGHQTGLWPSYFDGIDSEKYDWEEYPSTMNYNDPECGVIETISGCEKEAPLTFTNNEWTYIADNLDENTPE